MEVKPPSAVMGHITCFERRGRAGGTEEQGHGAIGTVSKTRRGFTVQEKGAFEAWHLKHHCRQANAVRVSGTAQSDVECRTPVAQSKLMMNHASGRGEKVIGALRHHDY